MLVPTSEKATAVARMIEELGRGERVKAHALGRSVGEDIEVVRQGVHVVVGTPSRTIDMINANNLKTNNVTMVVIDDSDDVLQRGQYRAAADVMRVVSPETQRVVVCERPTKRMVTWFVNQPYEVILVQEVAHLKTLRHYYILNTKSDWRIDDILRMDEMLDKNFTLIYCNTKRAVVEVCGVLIDNGYACAAIHGDLSVEEKETILKDFYRGSLKIISKPSCS